MSLTWTLHGSTERPADDWHDLHQRTQGWTAAWADTTGFHIGPVPTEPPIATHLWAWTTGAWLRARIDGNHWWAAILTIREHEPKWCTDPETLTCEPFITTVINWSPDDQRVRYKEDLSATFPQRKAIQIVPHQRTPVAFIGDEDSLPEAERSEPQE